MYYSFVKFPLIIMSNLNRVNSGQHGFEAGDLISFEQGGKRTTGQVVEATQNALGVIESYQVEVAPGMTPVTVEVDDARAVTLTDILNWLAEYPDILSGEARSKIAVALAAKQTAEAPAEEVSFDPTSASAVRDAKEVGGAEHL